MIVLLARSNKLAKKKKKKNKPDYSQNGFLKLELTSTRGHLLLT